MKALGLIIQREYNTRIKKKSFIVMTLLIPFLVVAMLFVPMWLSTIKDSEVKRIVVIDDTGMYAAHLQSSDYYSFEIVMEKNAADMRNDVGQELFGILQISGDLSKDPQAVTFYSEKQAPHDLMMYVNRTLNDVAKNYKLEAFTNNAGIDAETIKSIRGIVEAKNIVSVNTIRWGKDGEEKETSGDLASGIGMASTMIMYMFILIYGSIVMQGVIEEKTNRIVEVMVSSVRPFDLMMGKLIGIGLTGFTQLLIWVVMGILLFNLKDIFFPELIQSGGASGYLSLLSSVEWGNILLFFLLFFVGGYFIYASLFAMVGSAVDNPQDSQQFVMPITLIFIFALYAGIYSGQNPDGPLAFWCSMIPLTSPIVMMVRVPMGIPMWEILLSLGILLASVILTVKFAAKIYRVGILMYGKKPGLKELYKWAKYK
ncbi:ABC transporter permease [Dysgonomonas sp. 216]|uniref:ABC transporter permease n=1 Tax=Dysgonomonas sp. 216 TaxID=2302934 RepID=UPI0013D5FB82|nr:ABC transporter permease [Dysgonomonas sp. 216]NDW18510.1 ABC transporter permease [Dysgonomonas sp. 216]